jgi:diguanylate cyclase (GGDEF)-like protein
MHCTLLAVAGCVAVVIGILAGRFSATPALRRLRAQIDRLTHLVRHDPLSGVLNRTGLTDAYADSSGRDRYLILVDLDEFKSANDQHGHPAGDRILSAMGGRLAALASQHGGWAGRLGGDEFALVLPDVTAAVAESAATAAATALTIQDLPTGPLIVASSTGRAHAPAGYPWTHALTDADIALYQAKRGRHPVVYRPGMTYPRAPWPRRQARADTRPGPAAGRGHDA